MRKTKLLSILALMLMAVTGVKAADVLYATVSGTEMTLKYGELPSGATEYTGGAAWNSTFQTTVTTATVDESCQNYAGTSLAGLFYYMKNLTAISGLANLNTASATNMKQMFYNCSALTTLDLSTFNTAEVTDMSSMFAYCSELTSLDLSTWNTAKVTKMTTMFAKCSNLATITVGSGWNTDAVTNSISMFQNCASLPNFDSSKIDKTNAHTGTGGYLTAAETALTLSETENNATAISEAAESGKTYAVTLTRTLQTGSYNTFAVPFDISAAELSAKGITAKKLTASSFADGVLSLTFADAETIEAGKPYLVKVSANVVNPVFEGVTISNTITNTETTAVDFIPTMGKTEVTGDTESILFLGAANTLYYPTSLPANMKGFRAYFVVKGEAALAPARGFSMDFGDGETTGIISLKADGTANGEKGIYTLDGRKLQGKSTQKGVYIVNGKKVIK